MTRRRPDLLARGAARFAILLALPLWLLASLASAQAPVTPPAPLPPPLPPAQAVAATKGTLVSADKITKLTDKPQGWNYNLKLGANLNLASNKDVVGQLDGNSVLVGINILAGIGYLHGPHEWLNTFALTEAWSKTPDLPFIKSGDLLDLQTIYNYFINPFTGPFVRAQFQTSILGTDRITSTPTTYVNSETGALLETGRRFHLSDAFEPLTVIESTGWFVQPVHAERLNVFGRAGFGGRHTWVDGARAIDDDADTPETEVKLLSDVHQAGAELFAGLDGREIDGKILYAVGATALFPFLNNDKDDRSIAKLTRVQLQAALGVGIFSWMSLNYMLKVLRDVQLVDAVQVTNSLLLSFQYALQKPEPKPAPAPLPPEVEAKMEELEKRATKAEARAAAAEAQLQVEPPPPPLPAPARPETTPAPIRP